MAKPGMFTISIQEGATYDVTFVWKDSNRNPIDLTGYTAKLQVKDPGAIGESDTVLLEASTSNGRIILGGATGTIRVLIPAVTTSALEWTRGVYDLFLIGPASTTKLLAGTVAVEPSITQ